MKNLRAVPSKKPDKHSKRLKRISPGAAYLYRAVIIPKMQEKLTLTLQEISACKAAVASLKARVDEKSGSVMKLKNELDFDTKSHALAKQNEYKAQSQLIKAEIEKAKAEFNESMANMAKKTKEAFSVDNCTKTEVKADSVEVVEVTAVEDENGKE